MLQAHQFYLTFAISIEGGLDFNFLHLSLSCTCPTSIAFLLQLVWDFTLATVGLGKLRQLFFFVKESSI